MKARRRLSFPRIAIFARFRNTPIDLEPFRIIGVRRLISSEPDFFVWRKITAFFRPELPAGKSGEEIQKRKVSSVVKETVVKAERQRRRAFAGRLHFDECASPRGITDAAHDIENVERKFSAGAGRNTA